MKREKLIKVELPEDNNISCTLGCSWRFAIVNGERLDISNAESAQHGSCPLCGSELVAKKGDIREPHWSHVKGRTCDAWYESKGKWHKWWQNRFDKNLQEVPRKSGSNNEERHIADVFTTDNWVIEFQYSHLSVENVFIRENFYGDMLWVVNGTRLKRDKNKGEKLLDIKDFKISKTGMRYFILKGNEINQHWVNSHKLVFFDFFGKFNEPSVGTDILCLLPEPVYSSRVMVRLTQDEFIENIQSGNIKSFVERIEECGREFKEIRRPIVEIDEQIRLDVQAEIARQKKEKEDRRLKDLERERQFDLDNPALYAITCKWVEAILLINRKIADLSDSWDLSDLPEHGRIAIHLVKNYSKQQYWEDRQKLKESGIRCFIPEYEKLQKCAGMIIAKSRFVVLRDNNSQEWKLVILEIEPLKDFQGGMRVLYNVPDGKDVWLLSDSLRLAVNDRNFKQIDNPNCPICGKRMVRRKNKYSGHPFWGCSAFWDSHCRGVLSCDENGVVSAGYEYWCPSGSNFW